LEPTDDFFFSSRRRHTRSTRDWSSDVCSSDLKVRKGSTTAEKFIDVSTEPSGTFFLGMLADAASNTLWTCQLTPVPNTTPAQRRSEERRVGKEWNGGC